jgi:hypothetical protein
MQECHKEISPNLIVDYGAMGEERKTPTNFLGTEKFLFISRSCGNCGRLNQANNKG